MAGGNETKANSAFKLSLTKRLAELGKNYVVFLLYCQTPIPVQNWELTLLSPGNNNKKNNPHPNFLGKDCLSVVKICVKMY